MNTTYRDTIAHLIEMSPFEIEPDVQITSRAPTAEYLRSVGEEHRKRYGQKTLFDPAFGLGAFFAPVADDPSIAFAGSEKDPKILNFWTGGGGRQKAEIGHEDYLFSWGNRTPISSAIHLTCASRSLLAGTLCSRRLLIIWA